MKTTCSIAERELIEVQLAWRAERRLKERQGFVLYMRYWLPAHKVEMVMAASLSYLLSGPGKWHEREENVCQSWRISISHLNFAVIDNKGAEIIEHAIDVLGRKRALKWWRKHFVEPKYLPRTSPVPAILPCARAIRHDLKPWATPTLREDKLERHADGGWINPPQIKTLNDLERFLRAVYPEYDAICESPVPTAP